MTDTMTPEKRSALMSKIRGTDTRPEMAVRRMLHAFGYRFRLHRRDLPGSPDVVLPSRRTVLFVHGCFWHRHEGCKRATTPGTRTEFWLDKFSANKARDARNESRLRESGWTVETVWECETLRPEILENRLRDAGLPPRA
jgi:DNA mismatch endonuclease (patch repair protein)